MRYPLILALLVGLTSIAAAEIPRYDPASYCKEISEFAGGSAQLENFCIKEEQSAYDKIKANWSTYTQKAISYCDELARLSGGSYQMLEFCINEEMQAAGSTPEFKF